MTDVMNYLINFQLRDKAISCLDCIVEVLDTNFQQVKKKSFHRGDYFLFVQRLQKTLQVFKGNTKLTKKQDTQSNLTSCSPQRFCSEQCLSPTYQ